MLHPTDHVACNLCGADDVAPVLTKHGFAIVRCRRCELAYVSPRPESAALIALYDDERYYRNRHESPFGFPNYLGERRLLERTAARRLDGIERRLGRSDVRLLDVGCATGLLVEAARARGWAAVGVDVSRFATSHCLARGLDVHRGDIREVGLTRDHFDVVVVDDTIEHLSDPAGALATIHRLLTPGGLVTLNTPNYDGVLRRLMRRHWFHCKPPEHLYYFEPRTLRAMLEKCGFHRIETRGSGKEATVRYLCERSTLYTAGLARALTRTIGRLPGAEAPFILPVGEFVAFAERPVGPP